MKRRWRRDERGSVGTQFNLSSVLIGACFLIGGIASIDLSSWNSINEQMQQYASETAKAAAVKLPDSGAAREVVLEEARRLSTPDAPVIMEVLMPYENKGRLEVVLYSEYRAVATPFLKYLRSDGGVFKIEKRGAVIVKGGIYGSK